VIALAFLPSWPHLQAFLRRQSGATSLTRGLELTVPFFTDLFKTLAVGEQGRAMSVAANAWPFLILLLLGVVTCLQQRQQRALLWASVWILLPFATLFAIPSKHFFVPHYVIFVLPLCLLLVARGVTGVGVWLNRYAGARMALGRWLVPAFGMVALLVFGLLEILPLKTYYNWQKEDWRSAAAYLEAHVQPGDVIVCDGIQRGGQDSFRPCRALRYYFGSAFEENLVTRETGVAQTIESIAQEERGVWGLVFADLQGWTPGIQGVSVANFAVTAVVQTEDSPGNVLDKSIALLESFPEFMTEEGRFDVHLELGKLYTIQGDMDRAYEHLQLARAVMPEDPRATRAWAGFYAWFRKREFGR